MPNEILSTNDLVEKHINFANSIAYKLAKLYRLKNDSVEEAKSAAYIGLINAAINYKQGENSAPFKSYAYYRVKGAIIDSFRADMVHANRYSRLAKAYSGIADIEERVLNIDESDKQDEMIAKVFDLVSKGAMVFKVSQNDVYIEKASDNENSIPENCVLKAEEAKILMNAIEKLPEKEKLIIVEHYFNDQSFADISKKHKNYSRSWITRLHAKAIENLQEILKNEN